MGRSELRRWGRSEGYIEIEGGGVMKREILFRKKGTL